MRLLKALLWFIGGLALVFIGGSFLLPSSVRFERSILIDRAPSLVFPILNSWQRFNEWSPWAAIDPNATYEYSGPTSGVGAKMRWSGNEAVGQGGQEILLSQPDTALDVQLDFGDMGQPLTTWRLSPEGEGTRAIWSFEAKFGADPVQRWFGLLTERFVGPDYERGLSQLKTLVESLPKADLAGRDIAIVETQARPIAFISTRSSPDVAAIGAAYAAAYATIGEALAAAGLNQAGPPIGIDTRYDAEVYEFDAAIPVDRSDVVLTEPVQLGVTDAGRAVRVRHVGSYDGLDAATTAGQAYLALHQLKPRARVYTEFVSDPGQTPEAELISDIYFPIE